MKSFAQLFAGNEDCYTTLSYLPGSNQDGDKLRGRVTFLHGEVTPSLYADHVAGKTSIGIVPLREDSTINFLCIDVDVYEQAAVEATVRAVTQSKLPLVPCRSKSGGLHLYAFFAEPLAAAKARELAREWGNKLGLKGFEIFPAQDRLTSDDGASAINLPYFGEERPALNATGRGTLDLDEFIELANLNTYSVPKADAPKPRKNFRRRVKGVDDIDWTTDAPPCLQHIKENGWADGQGRHAAIKQMIVFADTMWPGDTNRIIDAVTVWNGEYIQPPKTASELARVIESRGKKKFGYDCQNPQFDEICDKEACRFRTFGVGKAGVELGFTDQETEIESITKLYAETGQPQYLVKIFKEAVLFEKLEDLTNYISFQHIVFAATNRLVEFNVPKEWRVWIMKACEEKMEISKEATDLLLSTKSIVASKLKAYAKIECRNDHRDPDGETAVTHVSDGTLYISLEGFIDYFERSKIPQKIDRRQLDWAVKEFGCKPGIGPGGHYYYVYKGPLWFKPEDKRVKRQKHV